MKRSFLDFAVCPVCAADLRLIAFDGGGGQIEEGILECSCRIRFPIIEGIPVLIEPKLRREILGREEIRFWEKYPQHRPPGTGEDSGNGRERRPTSETSALGAPEALTRQKSDAAQVWGYQWQDFHELWRDEAGLDQFYRWIAPLQPRDLEGRIILDAGCGTGRHVLYSAQHAKTVIGLDLSFATRVAERLTRDLPNAHIVQADIYRPPFRPETFDSAYSIGVIHHLPDPKSAYLGLGPKVKRGGTLTVWLYGRENNWLAACAVETARAFFTRWLPLPLLKSLSFIPAAVLWSLIRFFYAPLNTIAPNAAAGLPYNTYFMLFNRLSFRHQWMNVFDKLNAPIANYYRKTEMETWLGESQLAEQRLTHTNNISWTLHGIRK